TVDLGGTPFDVKVTEGQQVTPDTLVAEADLEAIKAAGKETSMDIRNGNGRTVKSRYATPDRVDHLSEKIDAVFWIMKDDSLPPI
ncbi:PTS glucose transporter subunit IIA, partial [Enterococcus faecium]|uniref:PTS glucose transporter subunit IIA n=1 Tax=Enterococcus faecium TaxID=1352 RepID=UPI003977630A